MLTENSEEKIIEGILFYINDYNTNKKSREISKALEKRIRIGRMSNIFNQHTPIDTLRNSELYFLAKELFNVTKDSEKLKPENFFTPVEIEEYENMEELDLKKKHTNKIVLTGVLETIRDKQWIKARITGKEIVQHFNDSLVIYNFKTQRETEKINLFGKEVEKAKVYKKSIKEMTADMIEGKYKPTPISYNILKNGYEKFEYDAETMTLTIEIDEFSEVDIIDGFHRYNVLTKLDKDHPEVNQVMQLNIFHYDVQEARDYIKQEAMKNDIKPEVLSYYNSSNIQNLIAQNIGDDGSAQSNFMFGNISQDYEGVEKLNKYCTYDTLAKAIGDNFVIDKKDIRERRLVKEYLIEYFNELISILKDDFTNVVLSRKSNSTTYNNIFFGYIALASVLYKKENWRDKLFEVLANIDFSLNNNKQWAIWNVNQEKILSRQINNIYKYFTSLIPEEVESVVEE